MRKELHYRYLSEVSIVYVAEKEIEVLESSYNFNWWRVQPYGVRWSVQKNLDTDGEMLHKFF